ncbi:MAG: 2-oxo acid dehydrogenase subunit E2, partial [Bacteroidia bacterium]|nr:2-oxo acid dehydrogenase subunit E2 [Bacteroidia bacterium]
MSKVEFKMPKLGESITEAAIITWFKKVGDPIDKDEMLLEVATDKVDSEVPSPVSGVVAEIRYEPNDIIDIGEVIAVIETNGVLTESDQAQKKIEKPEPEKRIPKKSRKPRESRRPEAADLKHKNNKFYSPLIENIAREHHISFDELARIPAMGEKGRLRKSDLLKYIKDGRPYKFAEPATLDDPTIFRLPQLNLDKGKGKVVAMDRMRQMIADHMVFSKHTSPHVTAYVEADLTEMVNWRKRVKEEFLKTHNTKLTFTPLFIEAVANAIEEFPMINVSVDGKSVIIKENINIGMATALP